MRNNPALPDRVETQLASLAHRVRLLRSLRGLSWIILALALVTAAIYFLDLWMYLPAEWLAWILPAVLLLAGATAIFALLLPLMRQFDYAGLAALIERKHPELVERLTTSVNLARGDTPHGDKDFIRRVMRETDGTTSHLVFRQALSTRPTTMLMAVALAALLIPAGAAAMQPQRFADFAGRFLLCWFAAPALQLDVSAREYVRRGEPWIVLVKISRRDERVAWPNSVWLIVTDANGKTKRLRMQAETERRFQAGLDSVVSPCTYHIEAGAARSVTRRLVPVVPVELTKGSPPVTITPPDYVNAAVNPPVTLPPEISHISALQFSKVRFDFRFTRPAIKAALEIAKIDGAKERWKIPLVFAEEEKSACQFILPMLQPGRFQLTLHMEAEHGVITDHELPELQIWPDQPPLFLEPPQLFGMHTPIPGDVKVAKSDLVRVAPNDMLHLVLKAGDAVGLRDVEIEYRVNDGKPVVKVLSSGDGKNLIEINTHLEMRGKVKHGDRFLFRIRVADNRDVPEGKFRDANGKPTPPAPLSPQMIYHPATENDQARWFGLVIDKDVKPLEEREIINQHDKVKIGIESIKEKIILAREKLMRLEQPSRHLQTLSDFHLEELNALISHNQTIKNDLEKLAKETAKVAELRDIADNLSAIADDEINHATKALETAMAKKADSKGRYQEMQQADKEWFSALSRLDGLTEENAKRADERLDAVKLNQLAQREQELSDQAAKLAKENANEEDLEKLRQKQEQLANELDKLTQNTPAARDAQRKANAEHAKKLAGQAEAMAKEQEQLAKEAESAFEKQLRNLMDDFAKKQKDIADDARALAKETSPRLADHNVAPPKDEPAQKAADALTDAQSMLALQKQGESAREFNRAAKELEDSLAFSGNPKNIADQLAKRQENLEKRLLDEAAQVSRKTPRQIMKTFREITKGQQSLQAALQKLRTPKSNTALNEARRQAAQHLRQVTKAMDNKNALRAHEQMQLARRALEDLASMLPMQPPDAVATKKMELARRDAERLRALAKKQRDLKQKLQEMLGNPPPLTGKNDELKKFTAKQQQLEKKAGDLTQDLQKLSHAKMDSKKAQAATAKATKAGKQAKQAMHSAAKQGKQGNAAQAKQDAQQAAKLLQQAAQQARMSAQQMESTRTAKNGDKKSKMQQQTGKALEQGRQHMSQAQNQLKQGKPGQANQEMKGAAQALQQAARRMAKQMRGKPRGNKGGRSGKIPQQPFTLGDLHKYNSELKKLNAHRWADLPGELQTRVLMDMRGQYGASYANIIQRYFERIADTNAKNQHRPQP